MSGFGGDYRRAVLIGGGFGEDSRRAILLRGFRRRF